MAPQRRPQHEWNAAAACREEAAGQGDASTDAADDGAVATGCDPSHDLDLGGCAVCQDLDVLGLAEHRERALAVGRDFAGDEGDGLHSASRYAATVAAPHAFQVKLARTASRPCSASRASPAGSTRLRSTAAASARGSR